MRQLLTLAVIACFIGLTSPLRADALRDLDASFAVNGEPVNPRIIEAFEGWISDRGQMIVAINLLDAQDSNQFSCRECTRAQDGWTRHSGDRIYFEYRWLGRLRNGLHVVQTRAGGDGSGVFGSVLILRGRWDIGYDGEKPLKRLILDVKARHGVGNSFSGSVTLHGDEIEFSGRSRRGVETRHIDTSHYVD